MDMYETKISAARWIAYDLPGNVGWIAYLTGMLLTLIKKPDFIGCSGLLAVMLVSILPAIMMLVGIVELVNERINKLD